MKKFIFIFRLRRLQFGVLMKRILLVLFVCLVLASSGEAAVTVLASASGGGDGVQATTGVMNATGGSLVVAQVTLGPGTTSAEATVLDNYGNTYTSTATYGNVGSNSHAFYAYATTVVGGTGFIVSVRCSVTCQPSLVVYVVGGGTGSSAYDTSNGLNAGNVPDTSFASIGTAPPGMTPAFANEIVISGIANSTCALGAESVAGGFSTPVYQAGSANPGNQHEGNAAAYLIETTAVLADPVWTVTESPCTNGIYTAMAISFRVGATGATGSPTPTTVAVLAVTTAASTTGTAVTSSPITTTGATLLNIQVALQTGTTGTLTDTYANTWTSTTQPGTSASTGHYIYTLTPTVGTGHTFTFTCSGTCYPSLVVYAVGGGTGSSTFDTSIQYNAANTTGTDAPGMACCSGFPIPVITPAAAHEIVFSQVTSNTAGCTVADQVVTDGFSNTYQTNSGLDYGQASGYYIEGPTISPAIPSWISGNEYGSPVTCTQNYGEVGLVAFKVGGAAVPPSSFVALTVAP